MFYSEIIQLKLDGRDKLSEEEKVEMCRDLCPRHLLADMLHFGNAKLADFNEQYNSIEMVQEVYGTKEGQSKLDELHLALDVLIGIVEIYTQVATFADDWFKKTLVDIGAIEWSLHIMNILKEMVEKLEKAGLFE